MGSRANAGGGPGQKTPVLEPDEDEVDSGWDDPPLSASASASHGAPADERAAPSSPNHEPLALVRLATPKPAAVAVAKPDAESLTPTELDAPDGLPRPSGL